MYSRLIVVAASTAFLAGISIASAKANDARGTSLSSDFRRKADEAMRIVDAPGRTSALVSVIEAATSAQVLRFMPILFPPQITHGLNRGTFARLNPPR